MDCDVIGRSHVEFKRNKTNDEPDAFQASGSVSLVVDHVKFRSTRAGPVDHHLKIMSAIEDRTRFVILDDFRGSDLEKESFREVSRLETDVASLCYESADITNDLVPSDD
jgi:hypothetical protein